MNPMVDVATVGYEDPETQTDRQTDAETDRGRQTEKSETRRQTHRQTIKPTDRQTHRHTCTKRQTEILVYNLLEVFLFEESDGFVNVQTVCEVHVLRTLHLFNTPVVAGSVGGVNDRRDDLSGHHYTLLRLRLTSHTHTQQCRRSQSRER